MHLLSKWVLFCVALSAISLAQAAEVTSNSDCVPIGKVLLPATDTLTDNMALAEQIRDKKIVLLGEHHDNSEHHRWQLEMITWLNLLHPKMVLGFEMFPRRMQPVLDRWVAGELTEEAFLKEVKWAEFWSFDPNLYLPLFNYARMNHIPMYALNVDRSLIRMVGTEGWDKVPEAEHEGVSKPAPASKGYKEMLASVFMSHGGKHGKGEKREEAIAQILEEPGFNRFVESQSVWDRAMAEGIAKGLKEHQGGMMVAVMGSGHMMYHFGVPEQLQALQQPKPEVLIPWDTEFECSYIDKDFADAVIGLHFSRLSEKEQEKREKPRLGIFLEKGEGGVLIRRVVPGSLAEKSGLQENDLIIEMAGRPITEVEQVIDSVKAMQLGTWLPIKVRRSDGAVVEIIAKFPDK